MIEVGYCRDRVADLMKIQYKSLQRTSFKMSKNARSPSTSLYDCKLNYTFTTSMVETIYRLQRSKYNELPVTASWSLSFSFFVRSKIFLKKLHYKNV